MRNDDITNLIERLDAFEERCGVRLESLSAYIQRIADPPFYITICGELHPREGAQLVQDIEIVVVAYDSHGRAVDTTSDFIYAANFFCLETIDITVSVPVDDVKRVRIYPKLC